jgi:hypothetical protein
MDQQDLGGQPSLGYEPYDARVKIRSPLTAALLSCEHRMEEDLHAICTRSASLLGTRKLQCCEGQGSQGYRWRGSGCGKPVRSF